MNGIFLSIQGKKALIISVIVTAISCWGLAELVKFLIEDPKGDSLLPALGFLPAVYWFFCIYFSSKKNN